MTSPTARRAGPVDAPPVVASQLEPFFNAALEARLGVPVHAVPRGAPPELPAGAEVLVAAPIDVRQPPPPGWPFGLKWIQLVTSGLDMHPEWLLRGLPVSTARGVAAEPIAEYVVAAIFNAAKSLDDLWVDSPGQWRTRPLASVAGSTVGLVGLGAIGQAVARKLAALGVNVLAYRRQALPSPVPGVEVVHALPDLLARADHLVLAAPATPETHRLLDRAALSHAKPGLHVVNVARGELIDDDALLEGLERGRVGRATLDVTAPEPLPAGHPFYRHPRIRLTPHTAAIGLPARLALADKVVLNHIRRQRGEPLLDQVPAGGRAG